MRLKGSAEHETSGEFQARRHCRHCRRRRQGSHPAHYNGSIGRILRAHPDEWICGSRYLKQIQSADEFQEFVPKEFMLISLRKLIWIRFVSDRRQTNPNRLKSSNVRQSGGHDIGQLQYWNGRWSLTFEYSIIACWRWVAPAAPSVAGTGLTSGLKR